MRIRDSSRSGGATDGAQSPHRRTRLAYARFDPTATRAMWIMAVRDNDWSIRTGSCSPEHASGNRFLNPEALVESGARRSTSPTPSSSVGHNEVPASAVRRTIRAVATLVPAVLSCLAQDPSAPQDVSLSGRYRLTFYDFTTGEPTANHAAQFSFVRKDGGWKLEITRPPLVEAFEKLQWVWNDGVMLNTQFSASRATNIIRRVMAVTTNSLPEWGWHAAIPLLLVFEPHRVLETNPPSIPRLTFLPAEQGQPSRVWCRYDDSGVGPAYPFANLRVYMERSLYAPLPEVPIEPKDPLLFFECRITKFRKIGIHPIPQFFYLRACYPKGDAARDDVISSWDVAGEVDSEVIVSDVPPMLRFEGRTLVVDYRVPLPGNVFASYYTTNALLRTNSVLFERMRKDRTVALASAPSIKAKVTLLVLVLLPVIPIAIFLRKTKQRRSQ